MPNDREKRLIREPEVKRISGLSRSSIYRRIQDRLFPAPVSLGGRAVAWVESEVQAWVEERIKESRGGTGRVDAEKLASADRTFSPAEQQQ